jgi:hypothetical protein
MAKKRGGEGSNMGLIITLVFFVLATCILGVTTWAGYSDQDAKDKAKKKAEDDLRAMTKERDWFRFQAHLYRTYMGHPAQAKDAAEASKTLALRKGQLDKGQLDIAQGQADLTDVANLMKTLSGAMPWNPGAEDSPRFTYETRLADKDKQYAALARANDQLKRDKEQAETQAREARELAETQKKQFDKGLVDSTTRAGDDQKANRDSIDRLQKALAEKGKEKETEMVGRAEAEKKLAKEQTLRKGLEGKLAQATKDTRDTREALDAAKSQLASAYERIGIDPRAAEAEALNAQALEVLKTWNRNWRIVELDRRGNLPYINLGSADGLQPQVTFSIHSTGADGRLSPTPKGTVEVVRVIGPHLAQARVTSVRDSKADPILKGDRLFNPTWDPSRKKRVALAGIADLGTEQAYTNEDFRRLLTRQSVVLDSYIDTKDDKAPKLVGPGITINTDYLILGEGLEAAGHPQARNKDYAAQYEKLMTQLRLQARENGVTVIPISRYLDMIGYRATKALAVPSTGR